MSLSAMIDNSAVAAVISNPRMPDNPIIACNQAFLDLTGYDVDEVLGRNCRFLAGPATEPWLTEVIREGVRNKRSTLVEILNYKKDGTPFRNAVLVAPIFDAEGELEYFLGSQMEVGGVDKRMVSMIIAGWQQFRSMQRGVRSHPRARPVGR